MEILVQSALALGFFLVVFYVLVSIMGVAAVFALPFVFYAALKIFE